MPPTLKILLTHCRKLALRWCRLTRVSPSNRLRIRLKARLGPGFVSRLLVGAAAAACPLSLTSPLPILCLECFVLCWLLGLLDVPKVWTVSFGFSEEAARPGRKTLRPLLRQQTRGAALSHLRVQRRARVLIGRLFVPCPSPPPRSCPNALLPSQHRKLDSNNIQSQWPLPRPVVTDTYNFPHTCLDLLITLVDFRCTKWGCRRR
ncbi:hypothetical protein R3P38DRAFT_3185034 [Favolaschia claudopus]|uniref:Uncharacterized protein n=1 Tax=Favolaschia claudopus TaxID=2862362 RepID=A0AAW0B8E8_9AGAR